MQSNEKTTQKDTKKASFFGSLFSGAAKPFNKVHTQNKFNEALNATNSTKAYVDAENELAQKTFAASISPIKNVLYAFVLSYPIISVITGGAVAYFLSELLAMSFVGTWQIVVLALFTAIFTLIIVANEYGKSFALSQIFKQANKAYTLLLGFTFLFSVAISIGGGYLLNKKANENFSLKTIENKGQTQTDSLSSYYDKELETYLLQRKKLSEKLQNAKDKYLILALNNQMKAVNASIEKIKDQQRTDLDTAKEQTKSSLSDSKKESETIGFVIALIIGILEIFYILAYFFYAKILKNIKTENRNFDIITPTENTQIQPSNMLPNFEDLGKLILLERLGLQTANVQFSTANVENTAKKAGFQFGTSNVTNTAKTTANVTNDVKTETANETRTETTANVTNDVNIKNINVIHEGTKVCLNCENAYFPKIHNQKFCSENCRLDNWHKKTGKRLHPKVKKKGFGLFEGFLAAGIFISNLKMGLIVVLLILIFAFLIALQNKIRLQKQLDFSLKLQKKIEGIIEDIDTDNTKNLNAKEIKALPKKKSFGLFEGFLAIGMLCDIVFFPKESIQLVEGIETIHLLYLIIAVFVGVFYLFTKLLDFLFAKKQPKKVEEEDEEEEIFFTIQVTKVHDDGLCEGIKIEKPKEKSLPFLLVFGLFYEFELFSIVVSLPFVAYIVFAYFRELKISRSQQKQNDTMLNKKSLPFVFVFGLISNVFFDVFGFGMFFLLGLIGAYFGLITFLKRKKEPKKETELEKNIKKLNDLFELVDRQSELLDRLKAFPKDVQNDFANHEFFSFGQRIKDIESKTKLAFAQNYQKNYLEILENEKLNFAQKRKKIDTLFQDFEKKLPLQQGKSLPFVFVFGLFCSNTFYFDSLTWLAIFVFCGFIFFGYQINKALTKFIAEQEKKADLLRRKILAVKKQANKDKENINVMSVIAVFGFLFFSSCNTDIPKRNVILGDSLTSGGFWHKDIKGLIFAKGGAGAKDFLKITIQDVDTLFVFLGSNYPKDFSSYDSLISKIKANHYVLITPNYYTPQYKHFALHVANKYAKKPNFSVLQPNYHIKDFHKEKKSKWFIHLNIAGQTKLQKQVNDFRKGKFVALK